MKNPFQIGAVKIHKHQVQKADTASFESGEVHPVYSTFALARNAEWACRLFVLEMKETHEEGIGSALEIKHQSPALVGSEVVFFAKLEKVEGSKVLCSFEAKVGERVIATGTQEQRILPKEKLAAIFKAL